MVAAVTGVLWSLDQGKDDTECWLPLGFWYCLGEFHHFSECIICKFELLYCENQSDCNGFRCCWVLIGNFQHIFQHLFLSGCFAHLWCTSMHTHPYSGFASPVHIFNPPATCSTSLSLNCVKKYVDIVHLLSHLQHQFYEKHYILLILLPIHFYLIICVPF